MPGLFRVCLFGELGDLPWTPAFVAESPVFYVVGLLASIFAAQVGVVAVAVGVAVLQPTKGCTGISCPNLRFSWLHEPSSSVPVPKFRHRYGSVPTTSHHFINSSVPNSFGSVPIQANSGLITCQQDHSWAYIT